MLYRLQAWTRFYQPIFICSLLGAGAALVFGGLLTSELNVQYGLLCYALLNPLMHFVYYEFLRPQEYYYYRNLQWSKRELWVISLIISLLLLLC